MTERGKNVLPPLAPLDPSLCSGQAKEGNQKGVTTFGCETEIFSAIESAGVSARACRPSGVPLVAVIGRPNVGQIDPVQPDSGDEERYRR